MIVKICGITDVEETEYLKTLVIDEMETADSTEQDVFDLDEVGQEDRLFL